MTFPHFGCGRGYNSFDPKKITVFPGTQKVGPICPTFIRGDPYEPHRAYEKVTFSDHQLGWFWVSKSCKSFCLASISVRYEVPTQFWNLPPITSIFRGWGQICPPRITREPKKPGINRVKCGSHIYGSHIYMALIYGSHEYMALIYGSHIYGSHPN